MKQKERSQFLLILILGLFVLEIALPILFAQGPEDYPNYKEPSAQAKPILSQDFLKNIFISWDKGTNFSPTLTKILLWALVTMVIYAVTKMIPGIGQTFKDHDGLTITFSVIVGFLSMAYITPQNLIILMAEYSALGFTIGALIPFLILAGVTISIASESKDAPSFVGSQYLATLGWLIFTVYLIYRLVLEFSTRTDFSGWDFIFALFISVASVIITLKIAYIMQKIKEKADKAMEFIASENSKAAVNREADLARESEVMSRALSRIPGRRYL
jgi:hypothetical protein